MFCSDKDGLAPCTILDDPMDFLSLLRREARINFGRLLGIASVAGLSNAMVLVLVSTAAQRSQAKGTILFVVTFIVVLVTYSLSQHYLMVMASREIEYIVHRLRQDLIAAVRDSELPEIENIGRSRLYAAVGTETQSLAQNANALVAASQMSLLVIFATAYLFVLSPMAFAIAALTMSFAVAIYLSRLKVVRRAIDAAYRAELTLQDLLAGIIDGFKEMKLNAVRSAQISSAVLDASVEAAESRITAQSELTRNYIFSQNVFFLIIATLVFIVPNVTDIGNQAIAKMTTAILFVTSAVAGVVSSVQTFVNANASAKNIVDLRRRMSVHRTPVRHQGFANPFLSFRRIEVCNLSFRYNAESGSAFSVGPFDFSLCAGEIVFITGGNGSGKSTFLRLLTALYWPTAGYVAVDGRRIARDNVEDYRALFAAVFSEYHLFRRLYGIGAEALQEASALMSLFEIDDKTVIVDGAFRDVDLSSAQRRRLALIVALLERRPICVLDEWAVDQDPLFRRKFYEELLPMFRARGLTVVAVSHDDQYFDVADRRLHMEEGRFVDE